MLLAVLAIIVIGLAAAWFLLPGDESLPPLAESRLALPASGTSSAEPVGNFVVPEPQLPDADADAAEAPSAPAVESELVAPASVAAVPREVPQPPVATAAPVIARSAHSPLQQAWDSLRAGDLAAAEAGYREVLRGEPRQPDAHLGLALLTQSRGERETALGHYRAVLESSPAHPRAWAGLSDLAGESELPAMESRLRGLIAATPEPSLHFALGNVLARARRWAEAQQSFFSAFSAAPDNADYAFNVAVSLDHLGKRAAAASHYQHAVDLAGKGPPVQFDIAVAAQRLAVLREQVP